MLKEKLLPYVSVCTGFTKKGLTHVSSCYNSLFTDFTTHSPSHQGSNFRAIGIESLTELPCLKNGIQVC